MTHVWLPWDQSGLGLHSIISPSSSLPGHSALHVVTILPGDMLCWGQMVSGAHLYPVTVTLLSVSPSVSPLYPPHLSLTSTLLPLAPRSRPGGDGSGLPTQCPILHVSPTNLHPTLPPTTNSLTPHPPFSSFNPEVCKEADYFLIIDD